MMNDLRDDNTVINLDLNKESIEVSLNIINKLAQLHSSFWGKNTGGLNYNGLKKHNERKDRINKANYIKDRIETFITKWKFILGDETMINLFRTIANNYNIIENELSEEPLTLCHGDVKSPNIFYKQNRNEMGGYEPYFIDWQYINYGKGLQDVIFFIIESFSPEKTSDIYKLFCEYYYVKLKEYGIEYNRELFEKDIRNSAYYFPFFVAIWFGTVDEDQLIDINFPYFFIQRLVNFYRLIG
jgi:thiamine kinase-like enzyme